MAHLQNQALKVERADPEQARCAFLKCAGADAQGLPSHLDATERGDCFKISGQCGEVFYSLMRIWGNVMWVYQASGQGRGLTEAMLSVIEMQAKGAGCAMVAFQTVRRGLVHKARALGYEVQGAVGRGLVLSKAVI